MMATVDRMNLHLRQPGAVPSPKQSKRQRLASVIAAVGGVKLLERLPQQNCLVVLNYHRIGSASETVGDPNLYSATPTDLERQVRWIKQHFHICTLDEAISFVDGKTTFRRAGILFTFDDGYKDNYDYAFPIFYKHKVEGTFFICTSYLGSSQLPWWDQIAFMLKTSRNSTIVLNYPDLLTLDLREGRLQALNRLLDIYKTRHNLDKDKFIQEIALSTGTGDERPCERLFINRAELKEMTENGMAVGSHTHSHPLLSHLTAERQFEELCVSKQMLEKDLGIEIQSLAYPVGAPDSFNEQTQEALRKAGYRIAFSFHGGKNVAGRTSRYNVRRHHVGVGDGEPLFRVRTSTAAILGEPLF
jgi:peptidoglycan/xylan/chitin deacetylase (PgdA/CDA1 family)